MVGLIGAWRNNWIHPCNKWFRLKTEKTREWDFNCTPGNIFLALCHRKDWNIIIWEGLVIVAEKEMHTGSSLWLHFLTLASLWSPHPGGSWFLIVPPRPWRMSSRLFRQRFRDKLWSHHQNEITCVWGPLKNIRHYFLSHWPDPGSICSSNVIAEKI